MDRLSRILLVTIASVVVTSCGPPSNQKMMRRNQMGPPIQDRAVVNAKMAKNPKVQPATHFAAAQLLEGQGRLNRAMIQYNRAIALDPKYVEAYHRLGLLQGRSGQHAAAIKTLNRAVDLSPKSAALHNNLGFEYMMQRNLGAAEKEIRQALKLDPKFPRARINLGIVMANQRRFDDALEQFRVVLPEPDAYYNLGLMYSSQRRFKKAAEAFSKVLDLNPQFTVARTQLEAVAGHLTKQTSSSEIIDDVSTAEPEAAAVPPTEAMLILPGARVEISEIKKAIVTHKAKAAQSPVPVRAEPGTQVDWTQPLREHPPMDSAKLRQLISRIFRNKPVVRVEPASSPTSVATASTTAIKPRESKAATIIPVTVAENTALRSVIGTSWQPNDCFDCEQEPRRVRALSDSLLIEEGERREARARRRARQVSAKAIVKSAAASIGREGRRIEACDDEFITPAKPVLTSVPTISRTATKSTGVQEETSTRKTLAATVVEKPVVKGDVSQIEPVQRLDWLMHMNALEGRLKAIRQNIRMLDDIESRRHGRGGRPIAVPGTTGGAPRLGAGIPRPFPTPPMRGNLRNGQPFPQRTIRPTAPRPRIDLPRRSGQPRKPYPDYQ